MGARLRRREGATKAPGGPRSPAHRGPPNMFQGGSAPAPLPAGRVIAFDKGHALAEPGVVRVLTHEDMPRPKTTIAGPPFAHSFLPLQGDEIRHEGQPIAMVLGETLEAAEAGARKVDVRYAPTTAKTPVAPLWSELDRAALAPKNTGYFFF